MLRDLHLRNLAVLAEASVEFGPGLNILTGETGAGKSIVVDSLALLAGARASSELIRTGADLLTVTGVFEPSGGEWRAVLAAAGVDGSGRDVVVRREINREGRNRVFVNDQPVTLRLLSELAPALLRIHGQREELGLVTPDLQRAWLDRSGGEQAQTLLERTASAFERYSGLEARRERIAGDERARQERLDLLRYQATEIDNASLRVGEEEALRRDREVLRNSEAIREALGTALSQLFEDDDSAAERLGRARARLAAVQEWEPEAAGWIDELAELGIRVDELAAAVRRRLNEVESDPQQLNAVEDRLALVEHLCRKYGRTTAEVLERRRAIAEELGELEADDEERGHLEEQVAEALEEYRAAAVELSRARAVWGEDLIHRMEAELAEVALEKARFAVRLEPRRRVESPLSIGGVGVEFGARGFDRVVFELSPNPGEALRPLARVASGGELSRIYLSLQLAAHGEIETAAPSLVFDEVDAGIGGAAAAALGRKLKRLASGGQILAVTHLPQVASNADIHFRVRKQVREGRTFVTVQRLDRGRQVKEIARMLAGDQVTEASLSHAEELIAGAG